MVITIVQLQENLLELGINVEQLNQNLLHDIGVVKNYGQEKVGARNHLRKIDKENISIFVFNINH
jgi:hypothetical protein